MLTMALLLILSAVPWSVITDNKIKDFNLFSDLLGIEKTTNAAANVIVDPELNELNELAVSIEADQAASPAEVAEPEAEAVSTAPEWVDDDNFTPPVADGHVLMECYSGSGMFPHLRHALSQSSSRVVRIAVAGDSFIEGDIFTQNLRSLLQDLYGGQGVGYMNLHTDFPGFRQSVRQGGSGWQMKDIRNMGRRDSLRLINAEYATVSGTATATYAGTSQTAHTAGWSSSKLLFMAKDSATITLRNDLGTQSFAVSPSDAIQCIELQGNTANFAIECSSDAVTGIGAYLDGSSGVAVDCMSVRGNSGLGHRSINSALCRSAARWIDYDLIILEYGTNAISPGQGEYVAYGNAFAQVIRKVQTAYPNADILLMGVGDRGAKEGAEVRSMSECRAMIKAQRKAARETGIHFYDLRAAQGGDGAIVEWRNRNLVNADYIHLNHRGGAVAAAEFVEALKLSISE